MDVTGRINTKDPNKTTREVRRIYENLFGLTLFDRVEDTLETVVKLFEGRYPGYQSCDTLYHDLEHTLQAYLAMARIFDGLIRESDGASRKEFLVMGLISALGHDTGFIKETGDNDGSGAKYTLIHVDRSKEFMGKYLPKLGYRRAQVRYIQNMISCTGLGVDISKIPFVRKREKETGYVLGTADFLGQMSDPDYLLKLPQLYEEFKEGGISGYPDAQYLIANTPKFFEDVVIKRLTVDFNSVYRFASNYFKGKNLYIEGITKNISKIKNTVPSIKQ
jgi:hypothetical protein